MTQTADRPRIVSPDTLRGGRRSDRTPPGQVLTAKWPVLHYGSVPKVDPHVAELAAAGVRAGATSRTS